MGFEPDVDPDSDALIHAFPWPIDHEFASMSPLRASLLRTLNAGFSAKRTTILSRALVEREVLNRIPSVRLHRSGFVSFAPSASARVAAVFRARSSVASADDEHMPDLLWTAACSPRLPTGVEFASKSRALDCES